MQCPHCSVWFHVEGITGTNFSASFIDNHTRVCYIGEDKDGHWWLYRVKCPHCLRLILELVNSTYAQQVQDYVAQYHGMAPQNSADPLGDIFPEDLNKELVRPKVGNRGGVSPEVPPEYAEDYKEACLVLEDSPKASAALSRRCLQYILRHKAGYPNWNLANAIKAVVDDGVLPSYILENLAMVCTIGNYAAHPNKNANTGYIVPVEPGEAEWCLKVIEDLFDFYFVMPAKSEATKASFEEKLSKL